VEQHTGPRYFPGPIEDYPPERLACRALDGRHAWTATPHWEVTVGPRGRIIEYHRALACGRCTAVRKVDHFDADMRRTRPSTVNYTRGYLAAKGVDLTGPTARMEQFRRSAGRHLVSVSGGLRAVS
jgi:hypothetical protein